MRVGNLVRVKVVVFKDVIHLRFRLFRIGIIIIFRCVVEAMGLRKNSLDFQEQAEICSKVPVRRITKGDLFDSPSAKNSARIPKDFEKKLSILSKNLSKQVF